MAGVSQSPPARVKLDVLSSVRCSERDELSHEILRRLETGWGRGPNVAQASSSRASSLIAEFDTDIRRERQMDGIRAVASWPVDRSQAPRATVRCPPERWSPSYQCTFRSSSMLARRTCLDRLSRIGRHLGRQLTDLLGLRTQCPELLAPKGRLQLNHVGKVLGAG